MKIKVATVRFDRHCAELGLPTRDLNTGLVCILYADAGPGLACCSNCSPSLGLLQDMHSFSVVCVQLLIIGV
jgi:hypothetical protein